MGFTGMLDRFCFVAFLHFTAVSLVLQLSNTYCWFLYALIAMPNYTGAVIARQFKACEKKQVQSAGLECTAVLATATQHTATLHVEER